VNPTHHNTDDLPAAADDDGGEQRTSSLDDAEPPESPTRSDALDIELTLNVADLNPPLTGWLDVMLRDIAAQAGVERGRIGLAVVDDDEMAALHEQYKQVEGTTDVLTFDLRESSDERPGELPGEPLDADIVLCVDEARRQASRRGHAVRAELLLYAVHGLLHLLDFDDADDEAAAAMHAREDELLTAAGLGPLFAKPATVTEKDR